jgi:hypothetical protein
MNDELEGFERTRSWLNTGNYRGICLPGLRKPRTPPLSQDGPCSGRDSNRAPLEHNFRELRLNWCSMELLVYNRTVIQSFLGWAETESTS